LVKATIGQTDNWSKQQLVKVTVSQSDNWSKQQLVKATIGQSDNWSKQQLVKATFGQMSLGPNPFFIVRVTIGRMTLHFGQMSPN
jgi:hypothetical protein